ncbi:TlpA family protein disulfide reductase [Virgibacillus sp. MSP4-1]|uniref:TlpA disulfide reductase family protein n=1 Tax=Virgibacillus sp. MSP4-1 TaxID=2700081 RepID=UPI00039FDAAB|nr:TlpA disulfide reductase family protein [Virgibacillus sp. MSP4-1]QHS21504.1 TlpA family protein disulfide reductase [Virgibacillus sp. MSP4-1]
MKKAIIVVVLVGMFTWAVYDFTKSAENANPPTDEATSASEGNEKDGYKIVSQPDSSATQADAPKETREIGLNVGNIAPDFELKTLDGETVQLSDFRGQRVMLNFWASWCPPCRAEMPDMEKFYQNKDVKILAVNLTQTESGIQDVRDFVKEFDLSFPILLDKESNVASTYQIQPIPTSYMINSEGVISFKTLGALNYDLMVQEFEKMR